MSDDEQDSEELRQAEALAKALDGDVSGDAPADALEIAALLRYAKGATLPSEEALRRAHDAALVVPIALLRRRRMLQIAAFASAAAVAGLAFLAVPRERAPEAASPVHHAQSRSLALSSLLRAQAATLADPNLDLSALSLATRARRAELFADLELQVQGDP